jgi:hypothetical protein
VELLCWNFGTYWADIMVNDDGRRTSINPDCAVATHAYP